jgi:putative tryptophan/tyrosine transport system substrate-binding protein
MRGVHSMALAGVLLLSGAAPLAAQDSRTTHVGYLTLGASPGPFEESFLQGMRERGYEPGRNLVIHYRGIEGRPERVPGIIDEFAALKVDIIVSIGPGPGKVIRDRAPSIPYVFTAAGDPVADGLVESLARPGGNATGVSVHAPELAPKRVEVLKEAVPGLKRMALMWSRDNPRQSQIAEAEAAGRALGIAVDLMPVPIPQGLDEALATAARNGVQGVFFLSDVATITHRAEIGAAALRHRMPTLMSNRAYLAGNTLMSFGPDVPDLPRRAAGLVDRILKGTKPADIPVEQPTTFQLVVNLSIARQLGIAVPPSILARADEVIE